MAWRASEAAMQLDSIRRIPLQSSSPCRYATRWAGVRAFHALLTAYLVASPQPPLSTICSPPSAGAAMTAALAMLRTYRPNCLGRITCKPASTYPNARSTRAKEPRVASFPAATADSHCMAAMSSSRFSESPRSQLCCISAEATSKAWILARDSGNAGSNRRSCGTTLSMIAFVEVTCSTHVLRLHVLRC